MSVATQRLARLGDHAKQIEKLLRANAYRHSLHQVFGDWVEMAAIAIANTCDLQRRETREARYLAIAKRYDRDEMTRFAQMLGELVEELEGGFQDALGRLFMALELGNHWKGQFFTPYSVCQAMARMQLADVATLVADRGYVTIADPCSGGGAMLIAAAEAIGDAGLNYQQVMHASAQDLDATAVHMTYLQLALLHVPAVVVHGDSLRMEENDRWYTPAHYMGAWGVRLRRRDDVAAVEDASCPRAALPTERPAEALLIVAPPRAQLDLFGVADCGPRPAERRA
jgi:hypothetical protein